MSRLSVPNLNSATGATAQVYADIKKAIGNVPNTFAAIGAHGPGALKAMLMADSVLAAGSLSKRDQETASKARGPTSRLSAIAKTLSASARTCTARAT